MAEEPSRASIKFKWKKLKRRRKEVKGKKKASGIERGKQMDHSKLIRVTQTCLTEKNDMIA